MKTKQNEFIQNIANSCDVPYDLAWSIIKAIIDGIKAELHYGNEVEFWGLGKFYVKRTQYDTLIPKFKPSVIFKKEFK